jgi:hypothetical protein
MSAHRIVMGIAVFAVAGFWFYTDSLGDVCPALNHGRVQHIAVPCTGSSACAPIIDAASTPGGVITCTDTTTATYWQGAPPTVWDDCVARPSSGVCNRFAAVCVTINLYKTGADCFNEVSCFTNTVEECSSS